MNSVLNMLNLRSFRIFEWVYYVSSAYSGLELRREKFGLESLAYEVSKILGSGLDPKICVH